MTSIDVNPSRIGYEAAAMLDKLMQGEQPAQRVTFLGPPRGIAPRRSTDALHTEDQDVAAAVRYIREHATSGIRVSDIVALTRNSPSTLERRVKKLIGRTIKAEITRVRLAHARCCCARRSLPSQRSPIVPASQSQSTSARSSESTRESRPPSIATASAMSRSSGPTPVATPRR